MIRISQLKLDVHHTEDALKAKVCNLLRIGEGELLSYYAKEAVPGRPEETVSFSMSIQWT